MTSSNKRLGAVGGLAALGGVAAAALLSGPSKGPTAIGAPAKQPVEVRTEVIRQTVHKVRREKPPAQPGAPSPSLAPAGPSRRSAQPSLSSAPAAAPAAGQPLPRRIAVHTPARAPKRIRTRTSPTGGHGEHEHEHEHETEHEGRDD